VNTAASPVCFGVCCPKHGQCAKYAAVDGAQPEQPRMDNCGPEFSAFEPIAPAPARAFAPGSEA